MLTLHDGDFGKNSTPQLLRPKCKRGDCPLISFRMRNQGWIKMLDIAMMTLLLHVRKDSRPKGGNIRDIDQVSLFQYRSRNLM